jgi:hypothetical protein
MTGRMEYLLNILSLKKSGVCIGTRNELKEKIEMIMMQRHDNRCFKFQDEQLEMCRELSIYINELSQNGFELVCPYFFQFDIQKRLYSLVYNLYRIKEILKTCIKTFEYMMKIMEKWFPYVKWSVSTMNFPNMNILNYTKKEYMIMTLQNQYTFLKIMETKFSCNKNFDITITENKYFDPLATYIRKQSRYDMYFIVLMNCSNIKQLIEMDRKNVMKVIDDYYFVSFQKKNMMKWITNYISNEKNWNVIIETDEEKVLQNYFLPHPDHFVYLQKNIQKENIIYKMSFPYAYMKN